jgi:hypothetical protein
MTENRPHDHDRKRGPVGCLVVSILLLPVLYVLSVGPYVWLYEHGYLSDEVGRVYAPLDYLCTYCPPVRVALQGYLKLWERQRLEKQWGRRPLDGSEDES